MSIPSVFAIVTRVGAVASLLLLAAATSVAQPRFEPILFEPPAPAGRLDSPPVYDPGTNRIYIFAGRSVSGSENDIWAYSFDQAAWMVFTPAGGPPPVRHGHTAVLDPVRRRILVFGGQATGFFNDTWAYNIDADTWEELAVNGPVPNRRYGHAGIYDVARDQMVISHGFTTQGRFDDTWALDLATNTWSEISPATARPLRRCLHHGVHDPAGDQMLMFGGCASGAGPCPLDDLWAFDLETQQWTELAMAPPGRQWYGTTFDTARRRMIVFGGSGVGRLGDTWEYDPATDMWEQVSPSGAMPPARARHEGIYVEGRGSVFFGGQTTSGLTNELWVLAEAEPPAISDGGVVNAFNFDGSGVAPGEIISLFVSNGGPADGVVTQFDAETGLLPFAAGGVRVTWNGIESPFYFAQRNQINVQAPYELAGATEAEIQVIYQDTPSDPRTVPVVASKAGLFPAVFHADGTINSADNPAAPASVVILFLTGQGVTSPPSPTGGFPVDVFPVPVEPVSVTAGGTALDLLFEGQAPFTAGVMQVNAELGELPAGEHAVVVTIGSASSQEGVVVWVAE